MNPFRLCEGQNNNFDGINFNSNVSLPNNFFDLSSEYRDQFKNLIENSLKHLTSPSTSNAVFLSLYYVLEQKKISDPYFQYEFIGNFDELFLSKIDNTRLRFDSSMKSILKSEEFSNIFGCENSNKVIVFPLSGSNGLKNSLCILLLKSQELYYYTHDRQCTENLTKCRNLFYLFFKSKNSTKNKSYKFIRIKSRYMPQGKNAKFNAISSSFILDSFLNDISFTSDKGYILHSLNFVLKSFDYNLKSYKPKNFCDKIINFFSNINSAPYQLATGYNQPTQAVNSDFIFNAIKYRNNMWTSDQCDQLETPAETGQDIDMSDKLDLIRDIKLQVTLTKTLKRCHPSDKKVAWEVLRNCLTSDLSIIDSWVSTSLNRKCPFVKNPLLIKKFNKIFWKDLEVEVPKILLPGGHKKYSNLKKGSNKGTEESIDLDYLRVTPRLVVKPARIQVAPGSSGQIHQARTEQPSVRVQGFQVTSPTDQETSNQVAMMDVQDTCQEPQYEPTPGTSTQRGLGLAGQGQVDVTQRELGLAGQGQVEVSQRELGLAGQGQAEVQQRGLGFAGQGQVDDSQREFGLAGQGQADGNERELDPASKGQAERYSLQLQGPHQRAGTTVAPATLEQSCTQQPGFMFPIAGFSSPVVVEPVPTISINEILTTHKDILDFIQTPTNDL